MWRRSRGSVGARVPVRVGKADRVSLVSSHTGQWWSAGVGGRAGIPVTRPPCDSRCKLSIPRCPNRLCQRSLWTAPQNAANDS